MMNSVFMNWFLPNTESQGFSMLIRDQKIVGYLR